MAVPRAITIEPADLQPADLERWQELAEAAAEPNPFFEPGVVLAAAATLPSVGLNLLVTRDGPEWTSCTPVLRRRNWRGTPLRGTVGWAHIYCFLGSPLVRAEGISEHLKSVLAGAVATRRSSFLGLPLLAGDGPVAAALAGAASEAGIQRTALRSHERAFLRRRADPDSYVALKPKHRREFRRLAGKMTEHLGCEPEVFDESDSTAAVEDFLRVEASGWKGRSGTAFAAIGHADFLRRICAHFRERGRLQLLVLRAADRALAVKCNFRGGDGLFCFKIGFDEELARFSPGIQLELATIERFHADAGLEWMDSCAEAGNEMINRLWPDRRAIETVAYTGGLAGSVARTSLLAARRAREMTRRRRLAAPPGRQPRVEGRKPLAGT